MAQRTAVLDYRTSGTSGARSNVISLAEATERQKRAADALAPALQRTTLNTGVMGAMFSSATARISSTTNTLGPLGAGLGAVARLAPMAGLGLVQMAAGAERAALMSRALNTTMLVGVGTMIAGGVAAMAYADDVIRAGDAYASLKAKIAIYTDSAVEAAQVEKQLYANARTTRSAVEGQVTLYSRLVPAVLDYGKGQEYALKVTELTTKALAIQGAEAREQWASTIQFSQAIGSGVLRGDEFRTLREAAPQLLRYVAKNLEINGKIGTSFSSLKKLADEGLLSTGKILDALMRAGPQIEADFARAPITAQQGWVILKDKIVQTAGGFAIVTGAQRGLFDWLVKLTDQVEAFRNKMLMDPSSFDGLRAATDFMGDVVGSIADVGEVAVHNFDAIVTAGQAVIALKLGEVFATWFVSAANASRQALSDLRAYQAAARMNAAATLSPVAAAAATGLRGGAAALALRATEMQARADIAAAQAAAAKTAAYNAANRVNVLKTTNDARSVIVTEAATVAATQAALATKLEEQAKRAAASATSVAAAASARNTLALEAEAIATAEVTAGTLVKNAAQSAAIGLYGLLGGAIGIATIALGALIFAVWKAEEAHRAEVQAQRDALVISDRLRGITDQLTASTWAQVPALLEKARAMRESAAAAREDAEAQLRLVKARQKAADQELQLGQGDPEGTGAALMGARADRDRADIEANLTAARSDEFKAKMESERQRSVALEVEARELQRRLSTGKDAAGRPISAETMKGLERRLSALETLGGQRVDFYSQRMDAQRRAMEAEKDPAKRAALTKGLTLYSENFDAAAGIVTATDRTTSTPPSADGGGKPKRVGVPGSVTSAATEVVRQEYLPKDGLDRFTLASGMIRDATTGGTLKARSEDEAAAAAVYVKALTDINALTDAQVTKSGQSREEMRQAASARLAYALSTSQASQAEDRWADLLAESAGESRVMVKAEREIDEMRARGANITDEAAQTYLEYVRVREAAKRAAQAVNFDAPLAKDATDKVMAGTTLPTKANGAVDLEAAIRQLQDRRAAILAETQALILAQTEQQVIAGELTREDAEKRSAERIAAAKVAVEMELQDRILKLTKQRADDQAQIDEARARHAATAIEGAFHDLVFGGDFGDIGKRLVNDLLETIYQELIGNPMRKLIQDLVRDILHPKGGGTDAGGGGSGSGLVRSMLSWAGQAFGFDEGGYTGGGGRRQIAGVVHGQEFVVNADATRQWLPVLAAINSGKLGRVKGYREGGYVSMARAAWGDDEPYPRLRGGGAGQRAAMDAGRNGGMGGWDRRPHVSIGAIDNSVNAPFAESQQLRQVIAHQRDVERAMPDRIVAVVMKMLGRR